MKSMYDTVIVGKTVAGKEIGYKVPEGKAFYEIFFTTGGEIPEELSGGWTDARQIMNRVTAYLYKDKQKDIKKKTPKRAPLKSKGKLDA